MTLLCDDILLIIDLFFHVFNDVLQIRDLAESLNILVLEFAHFALLFNRGGILLLLLRYLLHLLLLLKCRWLEDGYR